MAFIHSPKIVTNGLVFLVDSANPKSYPGSGTNVVSLAGNPNLTGSLINGPTFEGTNLGSWRFDGTNDHVLISSASADAAILEPTTEITVGIFAYIESRSNGTNAGYDIGFFDILRKSVANGNGYILRYANSNVDVTTWGVTVGGTSYRVDDEVNGTFGYTKWIKQWTYFAGTYSDTTNIQRLYINGQIVGSATTARPAMTHSGNLSLMANIADATQRYIKGLCGHAHIYNRALTPDEILQNYNALIPRFGL